MSGTVLWRERCSAQWALRRVPSLLCFERLCPVILHDVRKVRLRRCYRLFLTFLGGAFGLSFESGAPGRVAYMAEYIEYDMLLKLRRTCRKSCFRLRTDCDFDNKALDDAHCGIRLSL